MSEWFGGGITITGIDVQVTTPTNRFCASMEEPVEAEKHGKSP
jgi:hypothetical protein